MKEGSVRKFKEYSSIPIVIFEIQILEPWGSQKLEGSLTISVGDNLISCKKQISMIYLSFYNLE
jgi:hypothetical protein